jgi:hypothetical protein
MNHRIRCDHLGVKPDTAAQQTMQDAAVPVRPVHHRSYGNYFFFVFQAIST